MNNMSDKYDYGYNKGSEAHGVGAYVGKPAEMIVIAASGDFILKQVGVNLSGDTIFKLFWDGVCISTIYNQVEALALFADFCPTAPKKRGRPRKTA